MRTSPLAAIVLLSHTDSSRLLEQFKHVFKDVYTTGTGRIIVHGPELNCSLPDRSPDTPIEEQTVMLGMDFGDLENRIMAIRVSGQRISRASERDLSFAGRYGRQSQIELIAAQLASLAPDPCCLAESPPVGDWQIPKKTVGKSARQQSMRARMRSVNRNR